MAGNYWDKVLARRLSRRRAVLATGALTASAAFLAACGGDDDDDAPPTGATAGGSTGGGATGGAATGGTGPTGSATGSTGSASGLVGKPVDETASAKRGGTVTDRATFEPRDLDPHIFPNNFQVPYTYGGLFRIKDGVLQQTEGGAEGDVAESWEVSPDRLTITAKIHPGAHFAPIAPVNGRAVDAHDVVATWERHKSISNQRAEFANDVNPVAPIVSMTATDDRTVVITLKEPNATVITLLGRQTPGSMFIVPKEASDPAVLDLSRTSLGTGAFYLDDFQPSVSYTLKANPDFGQDKRDLPFVDAIHFPVVQEYATFLSQFQSGNIHLGTGINAEDLVPSKKSVPDLVIQETDFATNLQRTGFGQAPESPFVDERLRQAWVLCYDRDLWLDTRHNVSRFADQGIEIQTIYESGVEATTWAGWLLDPKSSDFGPNAKYFNFSIEEAKKLVSAATGADSLKTTLHVPAPSAGVPSAFFQGLEALYGMVQESGVFEFDLDQVAGNFFAEWIGVYHTQVNRTWDGVAITLSSLPQDPANYLFSYYNQNGSLRQGTDAELTRMTAEALREFDDEKRKDLVHEIQRYEGGKQFFARIGGGTGLQIFWPAVRNQGVYRGGANRAGATIFLDQTKPPFA